MNRLNSGFSRLRDLDLVQKTEKVITALTGNAHFPTTTPSLGVLRVSRAAFQSALAQPQSDERDTEVRTSRAILCHQLYQVARSLELTPGITDVALATTGYDLRKRGSRSDAPVNAPDKVRLKAVGLMGKVQLLCAPVYRAKSYEVQYAQEPNTGPWTDAGTFPCTRGIIISGLTRGKDYWLRIRAIGPKGPGAWSHPATIMAT